MFCAPALPLSLTRIFMKTLMTKAKRLPSSASTYTECKWGRPPPYGTLVEDFTDVVSSFFPTGALSQTQHRREDENRQKRRKNSLECVEFCCLTLISLMLTAVCFSAQPCPSLSQSHRVKSPTVPQVATWVAKRTEPSPLTSFVTWTQAALHQWSYKVQSKQLIYR